MECKGAVKGMKAVSYTHLDVYKRQGVYIVDELERSLHPKVSERLIQLFIKHAKGKRTQLIFTTHETSMMSQNIFRRDEIWFVEKNEHNASEIYSLDKFSERYDRKLDKAYLERCV